MRKITSSFMAMAILVASIALLQGCHTDVEHLDKQGKTVNFKASAENTKLTRTEYSGQRFTDGGVTKERINWVVGDKIRIWSDKAYARNDESLNYADYKVVSVEASSNHKSSAKIANVGSSDSANDGNGLVWGTGTHRFYSLYPSPDVNAAIHYQEINTDECYLKVTMPANQSYTLQDDGVTLKPDMNYAYMFAAVETAYDSKVELHYRPLFTAFQFTVDSGFDDEMTLYNFSLINTDTSLANSGPAGEFKLFLVANSDPDRSSASFSFAGPATGQPDTLETVNVRFNGTDGLKVTKGSPATFVVFARPQSYNRLAISFETSAGTKSLELKDGDGEWLTFGACTKTDINLSLPGTINYVLTLDVPETGLVFTGADLSSAGATKNFKVISHRVLSSGLKEKVSWKAQSLAADGTTWVDITNPDWLAWLGLSTDQGEGSTGTTGETVAVKITPDSEQIDVEEVGNNGAMASLLAATPVGSESAPRDLSLYDIYGNQYVNGYNPVSSITKAGSHTANCYIVNAPGYYCIPLVYGNAIDQTRGNASGVNATAYNKYYNVDGHVITSPYILTDLGISASACDAVVVWEDQLNGKGVIRDDAPLTVVSAPSGAGLSCDYIQFYLNPSYILPGNIVIALRDQDKRILWSWHIWIAPSVASDWFEIDNLVYRTKDDPSTDYLATIQVLNCALGWTPPLKFTSHAEGETRVRIVQDNPNGLTKEFIVKYEKGDVYKGQYSAGTYYQWGRKDPFLPSNGNTNTAATNRACHSPAGYVITDPLESVRGLSHEDIGVDIAYWIEKPYIFNDKYSTWPGYGHADLWNAANSPTEAAGLVDKTSSYTYSENRESAVMQRAVKKTIYDPCPAGFSIPIGRAFSGFTIDAFTYGMSGNADKVNGVVRSESSTEARPAGMYFTNNATHNSTTYTVFVPAAGSRSNSGKVGQSATNAAGYFWTSVLETAQHYGAVELCISYMNNSSSNTIFPMHSGMTNYGCTVKPMLEMNETAVSVTGENLKAWD